MEKISFIKSTAINKLKWDACIEGSENSLVYAMSFYLDAVCKWDALIAGDYETVMPLPVRKKMGITYLYQPGFVQQLGIFGKNSEDEKMVSGFLHAAKAQFRFAEITLNHFNSVKEIDCVLRDNYILSLNKPHREIAKLYDRSLRNKLHAAERNQLSYLMGQGYDELITLYKKLYKTKSGLEEGDYENFRVVCKKLFQKGRLVVRCVVDATGNLMAGVILMDDDRRLYNIVSCITETGRKLHANDFLYDKIFDEFSNNNRLFDFEGSDVEGIKSFYKKFGGTNQPYPFVKFNHLPKLVKLIKK